MLIEVTEGELRLIRAALHKAKHEWHSKGEVGPWQEQAQAAAQLEERLEEEDTVEPVTAPRLQSNRALEALLGEFEILKKSYNEIGEKIQDMGKGIECRPKDGLTTGQRQAYEALGRPVPSGDDQSSNPSGGGNNG